MGEPTEQAVAETATVESKPEKTDLSVPVRVFTQEDVTRIATKENEKGKRSAFNAIGINPDDSDTLAAIQVFLAERNKPAKPDNTSSDEALRKVAEVESRLFRSETKATLLASGMQADYVDDALVLIEARKDTEGFSVDAQAESFKTKYPFWFGQKTEPAQGTSGTGSAPTIGGSGSTVALSDLGTRLGTAIAKKQEPVYWMN